MKKFLSLRKAGGYFFPAMAVLLVLVLVLAGCAKSKKAYEDQMIDILKDAKTDLEKSHDDLIKVEAEKDTKKRNAKKKDLIKKQITTLEEIRDKVEDVAAPDDLYGGHSDLVEFLTLLVESRESTLKSIDKKPKATSGQTDSDAFKVFQHSGRAFSRASSELPFLEYELRNTFENVLQDVQTDVQQQSGFGQPSPGQGSIPAKIAP